MTPRVISPQGMVVVKGIAKESVVAEYFISFSFSFII